MNREKIVNILKRVPKRQGKRNDGIPYNRYGLIKKIINGGNQPHINIKHFN